MINICTLSAVNAHLLHLQTFHRGESAVNYDIGHLGTMIGLVGVKTKEFTENKIGYCISYLILDLLYLFQKL